MFHLNAVTIKKFTQNYLNEMKKKLILGDYEKKHHDAS